MTPNTAQAYGAGIDTVNCFVHSQSQHHMDDYDTMSDYTGIPKMYKLPEHMTGVLLVSLLVTRVGHRRHVTHVTRVSRHQELGGQRGRAPGGLCHGHL